jgi:hypothetical protein
MIRMSLPSLFMMHGDSLCITKEQLRASRFRRMHLRCCSVQELVWSGSYFNTKSQKASRSNQKWATVGARACRHLRAMAAVSGRWPSPTTRRGWRQRRTTALSRSGMRAVAHVCRHLRAIAARYGQWPSPTTPQGWRRRRMIRQSRSGMRAAAHVCRHLKAIVGQWPSPTTQQGWRRRWTTALSRSGMQAAVHVCRHLRAIAAR